MSVPAESPCGARADLLADPLVLALVGALAQPWFEPYAPIARGVLTELQRGLEHTQALAAVQARQAPILLGVGPLRFVDAAAQPPGLAYESFIAQTACVPTRRNVHDLFNALVWLRFAPLKARLNRLQADEIARSGVGPTRGAVRDALTLFDENGALWPAPPVLARALAERDWPSLFLTRRGLWRGNMPLIFGHALLEKLLAPRKGMTAHVWLLSPGSNADPHADGEADSDAVHQALLLLQPPLLAIRAHLPLPVLGVPGWWPANETPGFYDDPAVFRPLRR